MLITLSTCYSRISRIFNFPGKIPYLPYVIEREKDRATDRERDRQTDKQKRERERERAYITKFRFAKTNSKNLY